MRRFLRLILAPATLIVFLTSCTAFLSPEPAIAQIRLGSAASVGQSFVARNSGLRAITLRLSPATPGDGTVELALQSSPMDRQPIATAELSVSAVGAPGSYRFDLRSDAGLDKGDYYLQVWVRGAGAVQIDTTSADSYVDGNLYLQSDARRGDMVFQPSYSPLSLAGDWLQGTAWWWALVALAAAVVFLLPGLALLSFTWPDAADLPLATRLCVALGLGTAVAPLPMLWTNVAGLRPGAWHVWLPALAAAVYLILRRTRQSARPPARPAERWESLSLAAVAVALLAVRLAPLSQVEAPLWGDSYQHAMIAQLILDHGGLFSSWVPYVPYTTLTVQYGFPAMAAMFAWAMGGDGVSGTLIAGQVVNVIAALSLYPLARQMSGGRAWAGVGAVIVAGLLSPLPGYYFNWGRYAQLAGQAALPIVLWLTWALLEGADPPWRRAVVLAAAVTGMGLSYYRMAFLYAPFVLLLLLIVGLPLWRGRPGRALRDMGGLALAGALTLIFFLPWAGNVAGSSLSDKITDVSTGSVPLIDVVRADYSMWLQAHTLIPAYLLVLGGLALLAALFARRWMLAATLPWFGMVAAIVAGRLIGLPGSGLMQSFAVIIALYIPIGLAGGWLLAALIDLIGGRTPAAPAIGAGLMGALALAGLPQQAAILAPAAVIVSHPDILAMRWVEANTPADARFLVNGFRIYGGTSAVGADGGWWLPILAHRANTMPPQYALLNERPDPPDYTQRVVDLVATLEQHPPTSPDGLRALCVDEVTHVYIGQGQGAVGASATPLLDAASLRASPAFELIYQRDLVAIFKLRRSVCEAGT